ncbi:ATP-binding cassette domain-containing protein [Mucilaginibacter paludis]|uniref:ABC transporter related protein n=1 Tax=Mucilaginibacter paludis DSM 18603 TaxID=714943 RepID=H1YED6_9SPHI|nr:ATP-binding cassette domain-containing protein [Mucilaginibacter paludis]EHQ27170.1 ABC transporter related protein [Mucilaginibacter paludis DSM 18603]
MIHTLETDGVQLDFGLHRVFSDIYLKCETGKITGLLGRNGEGKTCLMKIISGNLNASSNSIRFDGHVVSNARSHPHLLLYLPQFNFIPRSLRVKQVLDDFGLARNDFINWFPQFELDLKVTQLSGGQWRMLEIYIIAKTPSQFAMLDEPFTHLNPIQIENIKVFLTAQKEHKGILITDHMYKHLLEISDTVYLLKDGKTHLAKSIDDLDTLGYIRL